VVVEAVAGVVVGERPAVVPVVVVAVVVDPDVVVVPVRSAVEAGEVEEDAVGEVDAAEVCREVLAGADGVDQRHLVKRVVHPVQPLLVAGGLGVGEVVHRECPSESQLVQPFLRHVQQGLQVGHPVVVSKQLEQGQGGQAAAVDVEKASPEQEDVLGEADHFGQAHFLLSTRLSPAIDLAAFVPSAVAVEGDPAATVRIALAVRAAFEAVADPVGRGKEAAVNKAVHLAQMQVAVPPLRHCLVRRAAVPAADLAAWTVVKEGGLAAASEHDSMEDHAGVAAAHHLNVGVTTAADEAQAVHVAADAVVAAAQVPSADRVRVGVLPRHGDARERVPVRGAFAVAVDEAAEASPDVLLTMALVQKLAATVVVALKRAALPCRGGAQGQVVALVQVVLDRAHESPSLQPGRVLCILQVLPHRWVARFCSPLARMC